MDQVSQVLSGCTLDEAFPKEQTCPLQTLKEHTLNAFLASGGSLQSFLCVLKELQIDLWIPQKEVLGAIAKLKEEVSEKGFAVVLDCTDLLIHLAIPLYLFSILLQTLT